MVLRHGVVAVWQLPFVLLAVAVRCETDTESTLRRDYIGAREVADETAGLMQALQKVRPVDSGVGPVTNKALDSATREKLMTEAAMIASEEQRDVNKMSAVDEDAVSRVGKARDVRVAAATTPWLGLAQRSRVHDRARDQAVLNELLQTARKEIKIDPRISEQIERSVAKQEEKLSREMQYDLHGAGVGDTAFSGTTYALLWIICAVAGVTGIIFWITQDRRELEWQYESGGEGSMAMSTSLEMRSLR